MDVGCGMGRNPYWFLQAGATSVLGVDIDDGSLAAARKNLAPFSHARVRSARHTSWIRPWRAPSIASPASASCTTSPTRSTRSARCGAALRRRRSGAVVLREGGQPPRASRHPVVPRHRIARCRSASRTPSPRSSRRWPGPPSTCFRSAPTTTGGCARCRSRTSNRSSSTRCCRTSPTTGRTPTWSASPPCSRGGAAHIEFVQGNSWHARITKG